MKNEIQLTIVGAEDILYYGPIAIIVLPVDGRTVTIAPGHLPQFLKLTKGVIEFLTQDNYNKIEIDGGFANVEPNQISINTR